MCTKYPWEDTQEIGNFGCFSVGVLSLEMRLRRLSFLLQDCYERPSEFPLASSCPGIIHQLLSLFVPFLYCLHFNSVHIHITLKIF